MPFKKKIPSIMVETKKFEKECCSYKHGNCRIIGIILVVLNFVLLLAILIWQYKIEADRVGWRANYKMVKQIYKSDAFEKQQNQQIQQALQMYKWWTQATLPTTTATATDTTTVTQPTQ